MIFGKKVFGKWSKPKKVFLWLPMKFWKKDGSSYHYVWLESVWVSYWYDPIFIHSRVYQYWDYEPEEDEFKSFAGKHYDHE